MTHACVYIHTYVYSLGICDVFFAYLQVVVPLYYVGSCHSATLLLNAASHYLLVNYNKVEDPGVFIVSYLYPCFACCYLYLLRNNINLMLFYLTSSPYYNKLHATPLVLLFESGLQP